LDLPAVPPSNRFDELSSCVDHCSAMLVPSRADRDRAPVPAATGASGLSRDDTAMAGDAMDPAAQIVIE
jgi:hypothetical protein